MSSLEKVANVVLRVPSIVLLDLLYRWDVQAFAELLHRRSDGSFLQRHHLWNAYYAGHLACVAVLLLPVRSLVKLYLYILTGLLLYVGHQTSRDYIRHEMERGFHGAVYSDPVALSHFATALTGQVIVVTLCALLLQTKQVWLFCAPLLPLAARLCRLPLQALPAVNNFAAALTALEILYVGTSGLSVPFHLALSAFREIAQVLEVYRMVALGMSLWRQLSVPLLFLVFWLALFTLQICALASSSSDSLLSQQGVIFVFLSSVAECCSTPYSLIGLTFTVSYLALGLLKLCKFYLAGYSAFQDGNVMHRGVTEGVTLLLLALQTGLLDLQLLQRTFLLSIILFIVVTSTLQSMIEIADPIVLGLAASQNRSFWKHFRGVSMCLFLLLFPGFMAYKIAHFFHMDFWLLILVSSCMLTSLQVMGTLFIYTLFIIELLQNTPIEKMDEIIYYVNAVSRVLEFLVAVCVVAYGTWESIFGEWSWMGASVIIIHCYFNVWLRAQSGWKSFLLRREAAKKMDLLQRATRGQLEDHNDVCAICFQEMTLAVIMPCGHFFHEGCLRKWFYVQDTCPLCHQPVKLLASKERRPGPPGIPEAAPAPEREGAPSPEEGASLAQKGTELSGDARTEEAAELSRTEQQGPQEGRQPFCSSEESGGTPPARRGEGASAAAQARSPGDFGLEHPPAPQSLVAQPSGDCPSRSGLPAALRQDASDSSCLRGAFEHASAQGNGRPRRSVALGVPPEVPPPGTTEGAEVVSDGIRRQDDTSSPGPAADSDDKIEGPLHSGATASPS